MLLPQHMQLGRMLVSVLLWVAYEAQLTPPHMHWEDLSGATSQRTTASRSPFLPGQHAHRPPPRHLNAGFSADIKLLRVYLGAGCSG